MATERRDVWGKIEILGRPMAATATALAVAAIGFFGQQALAKRDRAATFAQLITQREQAESDLRASMFTTILGEFFESSAEGAEAAPPEGNLAVEAEVSRLGKQLLKLELLALNFGETLTLSPLFREVAGEIRGLEEEAQGVAAEGAAAEERARVFRIQEDLDGMHRRLESLARRVSDWQTAFLAEKGDEFYIETRYDDPTATIEYPGGGEGDWREMKIGEHRWGVSVEISEIDEENRDIRVKLHFAALDPESGLEAPPPREFTLDYFDFPMIDNTRLAGGDRFAMVLRHVGQDDWKKHSLEVVGVGFPGALTSQRDKPVFSEVVLQLDE